MSETKKKFSGWAVLVGCILLMIFPGGLLSYTAGLFMYPICAEYGFTTSTFSLSLTLAAAVNALTSAFLVQYLSKGSKGTMKIIMLVSAIVTCGGFACMSLCTKLWQFFVMSAVWNIGYNMLTYVPVGMVISNWFVDKRATMTGIAFAGGNVGGAIFCTAVSQIMANQGWRTAYVIGGVLCFVFTLIAILLIKRSPAEYGQEAYGADKVSSDPASGQKMWMGVDKKTAMKSPAVHLLALTLLFTGIYAAGIANYLVTFLCTGGWEITAAGFVMTVFTLFGIVGNVGGGALVGKIGLKKGIILSGVLIILSLVCLSLSTGIKFLAYVFAALLGLACVLSVLIPSQAVIATFGLKDFAGIYGYVYAFYLVGCAISTPLIAFLAEKAGYNIAWLVVGIIVAAIILMYMRCLAYGKKFHEQYPD
jgi:MFS family permease